MPDLGAEPDPADAAAFNMACFRLSRALETLDFAAPGAEALARHLLRAVGRIIIDAAGPGADPASWAGTEEQVLIWVDAALREGGYCVRPLPGAGRGELPNTAEGWS